MKMLEMPCFLAVKCNWHTKELKRRTAPITSHMASKMDVSVSEPVEMEIEMEMQMHSSRPNGHHDDQWINANDLLSPCPSQ